MDPTTLPLPAGIPSRMWTSACVGVWLAQDPQAPELYPGGTEAMYAHARYGVLRSSLTNPESSSEVSSEARARGA